jgi:hypothetical protein
VLADRRAARSTTGADLVGNGVTFGVGSGRGKAGGARENLFTDLFD